MRLSFSVALVLSNVASISGAATKIPSLHGRIQGILLNNIKVHRTQAAGGVVPVVRSLQTEVPGDGQEGTCNADDTVNFDDDFNLVVFGDQYEPVCTCMEEDNLDTLEDIVVLPENPDSIDVAIYVKELNAAIGTISGGVEYTCVNGCAACFEGFCGILETTETSSFSSNPGNITLGDILNDFENVDFDAFAGESSYSLSLCITYTEGETGKTCFGAGFDGVPDEEGEYNCFVSYNGEECNSCTAQIPLNDDDAECYVADCTNIDPEANIDTCQETSLTGSFQILKQFSSDAPADNLFTLGSCDPVVDAPVAFPTSGAVGGVVRVMAAAVFAMFTATGIHFM